MLPQIKEYPEPWSRGEEVSSRAFCGSGIEGTLIQTPSPRNCEKNISVALSHRDCGNLLQKI